MSSHSSRRLFSSALLLGFISACSSGGGGKTPQTTPAPETGKAGQEVTAKDISNTPTGSVEKTLEGRFPGVVLFKTPSGGIAIRIRGATSGQPGPVTAIVTMAANNSRFMHRFSARRYREKIHNRPPTAHKKKRLPVTHPLTRRNASVSSAIDLIYLNF